MKSEHSSLQMDGENIWNELGISDPSDFNSYCSEDVLLKCFNLKLRGKNGGGRDRLTPHDYINRHKEDLKTISSRCYDASYKFSNYNERLSLKGRGKYPRVISIPTVRDRLVLSILNIYLQYVLSDLVNRKPANQYIRIIQNFIVKNQEKKIRFYKTDFSSFYDNVNRELLLKFLEKKSIHSSAFELVKKAINTPTVSDKNDETFQTEIGIPQGLAISNILSTLYLECFDEYFKSRAELYLRYVDDILLLNPVDELPTTEVNAFIGRSGLNLKINDEKTVDGVLWDTDLSFLGYCFRNNKTSLKKDNVTLFFNKLAKECTSIKKQFFNKELRPEYLKDDDEFLRVRIEQLNLSITGIRNNNRYFGWIHHYQQMDDISILFLLDNKLRNNLLNFIKRDYKDNLKSFVRCYYDIMKGKANEVAFDFDRITDMKSIKAFMTKKGWLDKDSHYDDAEIERLFFAIKKRLQKRMEMHIGRLS